VPLYRYRCAKCGREKLLLRSIASRDDDVACECGAKMCRVISDVGVIEFKTVTGLSKIITKTASEPLYIRRHRNWTPPEDFLKKKMPRKIL